MELEFIHILHLHSIDRYQCICTVNTETKELVGPSVHRIVRYRGYHGISYSTVDRILRLPVITGKHLNMVFILKYVDIEGKTHLIHPFYTEEGLKAFATVNNVERYTTLTLGPGDYRSFLYMTR